ncbi:hypothetical protein [Bifidobacterium simiarum]|nr:hypothetical protein [Bifidobacterium simiarum]
MVRSEAVKLAGLKSTYWLLGLTMILLPAGSALAAWARNLMASVQNSSQNPNPDPVPIVPATDLWACVGGFIGTVALISAIFGVLAITAEYSTKSIQSTLTASPDRVRLLAAKSWVTGVFVFAATLVGLLISWALVTIMAGQWQWRVTPLAGNQRHLPWVVMLGGPLVLMLIARMALGIGAIIRSTVGAVLTLIGLLTILPTAASLFVAVANQRWLSVLVDLLPSSAIGTFMQAGASDTVAGTDGSAVGSVDGSAVGSAVLWSPNWWQSLLVLIVWWLVADAIGTLIFRRTDIR